MAQDNLERMIKLAEDFFGTRNDPAQISVTEETMIRLRNIHPGTLSEERNESGPIAWVLIIPTMKQLMEQFNSGRITERELLDLTPLNRTYDVIYLCSALVLPEYRGRGFAKRLTEEAIRSIQKEHPIQSLFVWEFSAEGEKLASAVAKELGLPLEKRKN